MFFCLFLACNFSVGAVPWGLHFLIPEVIEIHIINQMKRKTKVNERCHSLKLF